MNLPEKSNSHLLKRGIDFDSAQMLWQDIDLIWVFTKTTDELRTFVIDKIDAKHGPVAVTSRDPKFVSQLRVSDEAKAKKK